MHPDEHLLRGLGRAARLVPSLGSALAVGDAVRAGDRRRRRSRLPPRRRADPGTGRVRSARPTVVALLESAGGSPAEGPDHRRRARRRPTTIGLDGLCDIEWEAVLGDDKIGLAELRELARLKQPLVRIRGQWVELREGDIAAAIAAVGKKGADADRMSAGEVLRTALGIEPTIGDLPVVGRGGRRMARRPSRRCRGPSAARPGRPPTASSASCGPTRSADSDGSRSSATSVSVPAWPTTWGSARRPSFSPPGRRAARALGRPVGTFRPRRRTVASVAGPTLVLCPMSLVGNWQREAARFAPELSVYVHHGPDRLDGKAFTRNAAQDGPGAVDLRSRRARPASCSPPSRGAAWSSTRRSRSRTARPARPRASGRSRPSGGSP